MDEDEANAVRAKIARIEKRLRELDELKEEKKRKSKPTGGDLAAFLINERLEAERAAREEEERSRQSKLTGGDLVAFLINERVDAERAAREEESDTEDESEYETEAEEEWEEESDTKFDSVAASEEESVSVSFEEPVAESTGEWEGSEGDYEAGYEESDEEDWKSEEESLESESEGEFEDAEIVADEDGAETDSDSDSEFWADLEGQAERNRQLRSDIRNWLSYRLSGRYYSDKLRDKQPAVESEGWCESGKREEEAVTAKAEDSSSSRVAPPRDESEHEHQLSQEERDLGDCELVSTNGEGRKELPEKRVEDRGDQEECELSRDELESCAVENCEGAGPGDGRHQAETGTVTLRPDAVSEEPVETHRRLVTENYVERDLRLVKDRGKL